MFRLLFFLLLVLTTLLPFTHKRGSYNLAFSPINVKLPSFCCKWEKYLPQWDDQKRTNKICKDFLIRSLTKFTSQGICRDECRLPTLLPGPLVRNEAKRMKIWDYREKGLGGDLGSYQCTNSANRSCTHVCKWICAHTNVCVCLRVSADPRE